MPHALRLTLLIVFVGYWATQNNYAYAQSKAREYREFSVQFDGALSNVPTEVFDGKRKIGTVHDYSKDSKDNGILFIRVHRDYASIIEYGIYFYVSGDRLEVYRLWSTGIDAESGTTFHGHENQFGIFMHELGMLLDSLKSSLTPQRS